MKHTHELLTKVDREFPTVEANLRDLKKAVKESLERVKTKDCSINKQFSSLSRNYQEVREHPQKEHTDNLMDELQQNE